MQTELIKELNNVLKSFPKYWEGEKLLRTDVVEAIENKQEDLIKALISNEKIKAIYGKDIAGILVFDFEKLTSLLKYKEYWANSFTKFKNKIGLTANGKYLDYSSDIVLNFPFKDCVLEGGMTKDDSDREEIYYNEVIAQNEIDRLFSPKVLVNAKRYSSEGVEDKINSFNEMENLIIKGNNLIALHSLKHMYSDKVKLIYIDPPFNTGKDEFKYNDSFNHSTWLTFMKNRLEIAKKLLSNDGVIVVHVGNEEASYIQVLLDEIFKRRNYLNHITMTTNAPSGFKATSAKIFSTSNHIYIYGKEKSENHLYKTYTRKNYDAAYKFYLLNPEEDFFKWKYKSIIEVLSEENGYENIDDFKRSCSKSELYEKLSEFAFARKNQVFRTAAIGGGALKKRKKTVLESKKNKNVVMQHPGEDVENFYILNGEMIVFWANTFKNIDGDYVPSQALTDVWTDIGFTGIANEGKVTLKNGKKPELLLKRIIELSTQKDDLVLDYHLGSGTTCAVAHKMGRRYIGIEQMDYINEISVPRLQNVIEKDQSGISKKVKWQGGGSFVYAELMELNVNFINKIHQAQSYDELKQLFAIMETKAYLNYQGELENVLSSEYEIDGTDHKVSFNDLELSEQKQLLIEILDKNQLYANMSEMDDDSLSISENDKAFTRNFYGKE